MENTLGRAGRVLVILTSQVRLDNLVEGEGSCSRAQPTSRAQGHRARASELRRRLEGGRRG